MILEVDVFYRVVFGVRVFSGNYFWDEVRGLDLWMGT